MARPQRRTRLFVLLCLLALIAVPVILTWRAVQQERLNHALITAVRQNDVLAVRSLLHEGADPNVPVPSDDNRSFWQRLWDGIRYKPSPHPRAYDFALLEAVQWVSNAEAEDAGPVAQPPYIRENTDIVKALVEAGADVNARGNVAGFHNTTPLIEAAIFDKFDAMKVLLAHHADFNAVDNDGYTALICTAIDANGEMNGALEMLEALLQRGANVNVRDFLGRTALFCVLQPHQGQEMERLRETVACLLRHGASIQGKDANGNTVLSLARNYGDKDLTQMLQQASAKE